jgi:adenylate cyclase
VFNRRDVLRAGAKNPKKGNRMAKLYIFTKKGRSEYNLVDHNVIGRHPKNRIKILEAGISKVHCLIASEENQTFSIRDLGSRNGTYINGTRLKGKMFLKDGDEIKMGHTLCLFREQMEARRVKWRDDDKDAIRETILHKVAPQQMNKFFPETNIIDEEMLRADYERLRISFELQRDIGFDLHVDFILGRVLDRAFEVLAFDQGVVLLLDPQGAFAIHAYKTKTLGDELIISRTLADLVADDGQGVVLMNPNPSAGREAPEFIETPVQTTLAVPILDEHDLQGVIILDRWAAYHPYREKDLNLLSNVANKTALFMRNSQIAKSVTRESLERERFRKILSPEMAEMVVAGQLKVDLEGKQHAATLLMVNMIDFNAQTGALDPEGLIEFLNQYYDHLVGVVFRHEGMIDQYLGDRILAVWGVPQPHEDDPLRAVTAAVEMQQMMEAINQQRQKDNLPLLEIGIGVATGTVVAGSLGSQKTRRYSIVGELVNDVQAICASARSEQVLISEKTFKMVQKLFDIDEAHTLQLRDRAVKCFEIIGEQEGRPAQPWSYLG